MTPARPVRFGLSLPNRAVLFGFPVETLVDVAERADASDYFDSLWVGDNFLSKPRLEAVTFLSLLAGRTKRLKLGTVCLASFPLRHPIAFAIQWASLDVLSQGRTILVVCNGGAAKDGPVFAAELAAFGVASNERMGRLEEGIEILRRLFGPGPASFHGTYYQFDDVLLAPKPIQARVPIGIANNPVEEVDPTVEEKVLRRIARLADSWQMDAVKPAVFQRRWARVQEYAAEYGRVGQVDDAQLHLMVNINDDREVAYAQSAEFFDRYYGPGSVKREFIADWLAYGSPADIIEKIQSFTDAGMTTIILRFTSPAQREQLERCITEVLPHIRRTTPSQH